MEADTWFFRGLAAHFHRPVVATESYRRANAVRAEQADFYPQAVLHLARAHNLGKRLNAGMVGLNCQLTFDHNVPFGGYKHSGVGKEFGYEGIDGYLKTKSIWAAL